jgi:hypothetical protein
MVLTTGPSHQPSIFLNNILIWHCHAWLCSGFCLLALPWRPRALESECLLCLLMTRAPRLHTQGELPDIALILSLKAPRKAPKRAEEHPSFAFYLDFCWNQSGYTEASRKDTVGAQEDEWLNYQGLCSFLRGEELLIPRQEALLT